MYRTNRIDSMWNKLILHYRLGLNLAGTDKRVIRARNLRNNYKYLTNGQPLSTFKQQGY